MDKLNSIGVYINDKEQLKIIPDEAEAASVQLASRTRDLLQDLNLIQEHLDKTINLLQKLDEQNERSKTVEIASIISKIINP